MREIAVELCRLMQEQVDALAGRELSNLTGQELADYEKRKSRILVLRRDLQRFVTPI